MTPSAAQITDTERPLPLKEQAYRQLLALLMSGELTPESSWSERQLAARLGMSKTPDPASRSSASTATGSSRSCPRAASACAS